MQCLSQRGPNMIAILVMKGTKYDCNDDHNGTSYECNFDNQGDLIWLNCSFQIGLYINNCNLFQNGPKMIAKFVLESRDYDFWTNLAKRNFPILQS